MYDLVIQGGVVFDGTGAPPTITDVCIKDGRITALGHFDASSAQHVIEAHGAMVLPGFVDLHTHYDLALGWDGLSEHLLRQGITTVVGGNCGTRPQRRGIRFGFRGLRDAVTLRAPRIWRRAHEVECPMRELVRFLVRNPLMGWVFGEGSANRRRIRFGKRCQGSLCTQMRDRRTANSGCMLIPPK